MKIITDYIKKYPHYLKILTNYYYIKENYSGQIEQKAYKIGYTNDISEEYKDDYGTPKKWNLYPVQWMYGGEKNRIVLK